MSQTNLNSWFKDSWRNFPAQQLPQWPDLESYKDALQQIATLPPLVFAGEINSLKQKLAKAVNGEAFLLQGGDCAEEFNQCTAPRIRDTLKVLLQMSVILTYAGEKPVIKVGRMAGQYAKPRSSDSETQNGLTLPSYRGDCVNSPEFTLEARTPDAKRLLKAYYNAAATQNIIRAYTRGGFAALSRVHAWNNTFVKNSKQGKQYEDLAKQIDQALIFMQNIGLDHPDSPQLSQVDFYTSHEALMLSYEEALTRKDSLSEEWYDCSAHMIWIGDRTRQLDGAHVEYCRGVKNPIGIKVGPNYDADEIQRIIRHLNPSNEAGKIILTTRFGVKKVQAALPPLVRKIKDAGLKVLWSCDPMHGNTFTSKSGHKTRSFDDIMSEIHSFFQIHWTEGSVPGGIHCELSGEDVTECIGGGQKISEEHLPQNYQTACDPRLNAQQSLDLAFHIAQMLRDQNN